MDEDAINLMEEMTRFEAEIASESPAMPAAVTGTSRPIIGANTFNQVQQQLDGTKLNLSVATGIPNGLQIVSNFADATMYSGIPPPPTPPSFLIPNQVRQTPVSTSGQKLRPGPAILSAAPTKYKAPRMPWLDNQLDEFLNEIKKEEASSQKKSKTMADKVRANTVVTVQSNPPLRKRNCQMGFSDIYNYTEQPSKKKRSKKTIRLAGGQVWEDPSLLEWEDDDFRIFCGDLGNDVTDEILIRAFNKYPSFLKAKVVRDKRTNKTKGFGFVSFKDPQDFIKAMKEMNGRYVGSRPIKLRKSSWKQRSIDVVKKKEKEKAALINLLTGK